ncbi:MAG: hypothetical protein CMF76_03775 [Maricaulis sp.]|nr:hypothetical protein [Maricaulis sp.]|tara:strand:- start:433 stop:768 length:336 start_codon:yes stop_codon:yes gene_type:complete
MLKTRLGILASMIAAAGLGAAAFADEAEAPESRGISGPEPAVFAGEPVKITTVQHRLSARDIDAILTEAGRDSLLPDNCWYQYSPFTGECIAVICEVGGVWEIMPGDCDDY